MWKMITNKWIKQRELREHLETEQFIRENTLGGQLEILQQNWLNLKVEMWKAFRLDKFLDWIVKAQK